MRFLPPQTPWFRKRANRCPARPDAGAPHPTPRPCGVLSGTFSPGSSIPLEWGWDGHRSFPPLFMGVLRAFASDTPEGLTFIVPNSRPFSVPHPPL